MKAIILQQRIDLMRKLGKIKEIELKERSFCMCKSFCRITHSKHNWCKLRADQYLDTIRSMDNSNHFRCRKCNKSCTQVYDLKKHT